MGNYHICVNAHGRVTRKEKIGRPPSLGRTLDGVWCTVGKKKYMECRVGQIVTENIFKSLPEDRVRLIKSIGGDDNA